MRRYVSVWGMSKRGGFTFIEVMVAVMIISVVVAALLQLQSNNTESFTHLRQIQKNIQYISLLSGSKYGYENDTLTLDGTLDRFDIEDDLRRELKEIKVNILYQSLQRIDTKDFDLSLSEANASSTEHSPLVIEIGRTIMQLPEGSVSVMRIRIP